MAFEASSVAVWRCLESPRGGLEGFASADGNAWVSAIIGQVAVRAFNTLMVDLVVREVAWKLALHDLFILSGECKQVVLRQARTCARVAGRANGWRCPAEKLRRCLAMTFKARIVIGKAFNGRFGCGGYFVGSQPRRNDVAA